MSETGNDSRRRYLSELTIRLRAEGFDSQPPSSDGLVTVEWQGQPLCRVNGAGNTLYRSEDVILPEIERAKDRVVDIASTIAEYMRLMASAPQLKAGGLEGDYRILADFNGTVLAGHPTQYGVEFITWDWDFDRKGVSHGHYFNYGDFGNAKQDFAARSGLVREDAFFTPEQLTDLYGCITFTRSQGESLTYGHDQRLDRLLEQINALLPDVMDRLEQRQAPQAPEMGGLS